LNREVQFALMLSWQGKARVCNDMCAYSARLQAGRP